MTVRPGWHPVIGDPPPPVSSFAFRLAAVASSTVISSVVGQRHRFLLFVRRFDYSNRFRAPFLPHVSFRSPDGCVYNITPEYITYHLLQRDFWKIIILRITWYENITSNSPYNRSDFYYYQFSYVTFGWSELTIIGGDKSRYLKALHSFNCHDATIIAFLSYFLSHVAFEDG